MSEPYARVLHVNQRVESDITVAAPAVGADDRVLADKP
jgi:hypothetical protein